MAPILDARFGLALYCDVRCDDSVLSALDRQLAGVVEVPAFADSVTTPSRMMGLADTVAYPVTSVWIAGSGVGISRPDRLLAAEQVVVAWFASPANQAEETLTRAHTAFAAASAGGGWVHDLTTDRVYGAAAWARLDTHALGPWVLTRSGGGQVRSVGMRRFAEYDLVVENVTPEGTNDAALVVFAALKATHEKGPPPAALRLDDGATRGAATFAPADAVPPPGAVADPDGRYLTLHFSGETSTLAIPVGENSPIPAPPVAAPPPETDNDARAAIPTGTPAPTNLEQARAAVRESLLLRVRPEFLRGLKPGDALAVMVGFHAATGRMEYLWVEVRSWSNGVLSGMIATEPALVPLRRGDSVRVREDEVFDYVVRRADGSKEGNLTKPFRK